MALAIPKAIEHDRVAGRTVPLAPQPFGRGSALYPTGRVGAVHVPHAVDYCTVHGDPESTDEDDDVDDAWDDDVHLPQPGVGPEPLLRDREPNDASTAVLDCQGAPEDSGRPAFGEELNGAAWMGRGHDRDGHHCRAGDATRAERPRSSSNLGRPLFGDPFRTFG